MVGNFFTVHPKRPFHKRWVCSPSHLLACFKLKQIRSLVEFTAEHQGSSQNANPSKDGVEKEELLFSGSRGSLDQLSCLRSRTLDKPCLYSAAAHSSDNQQQQTENSTVSPFHSWYSEVLSSIEIKYHRLCSFQLPQEKSGWKSAGDLTNSDIETSFNPSPLPTAVRMETKDRKTNRNLFLLPGLFSK